MNKLDINKPVQTRGGKPARIIATDVKSPYPIVALVKVCINNNEEFENNVSYTKDGKCFASQAEESPNDLINIPVCAYRPWTQADAAALGVCGCTVRFMNSNSLCRGTVVEVKNDALIVSSLIVLYSKALDEYEILLNGQWQRCGIKI